MNEMMRQLRILSMLGQRGTFGMTLQELAKTNPDIFALSADLTNTAGLDRFATNYPDRFVNTGIAEQDMIGISAGLASEGFIPFCVSFANFSALRANEFARHFLSYMKGNIKLVGMGAGFAMGMFGNTHYGVEDVAVLRSFPNILILSPSDCLETKKAVIAAAKHVGPVYLRLSGEANQEMVYTEDFSYDYGRPDKLKEGDDAAIYATGGSVYQALQAAITLEQEDLHVQVWNVHSLNEIPTDSLVSPLKYNTIFSIEEHRVVGGLGSLLAETLSKYERHPSLVRLGVPMSYNVVGTNDYCLHCLKLDKTGIVDTIKNKLLKEN